MIEQVGVAIPQNIQKMNPESVVMDTKEVLALLALGLKGNISLPDIKHEVDILV